MRYKIQMLVLNMVKKFILVTHKFQIEDVLKSEMGTAIYRVEGLFYNLKLEPVVIVRDQEGRMASIREAELVKTKQQYAQVDEVVVLG